MLERGGAAFGGAAPLPRHGVTAPGARGPSPRLREARLRIGRLGLQSSIPSVANSFTVSSITASWTRATTVSPGRKRSSAPGSFT